MTGPEEPVTAGGGQPLAGSADRQQVIEELKDAFLQGRLTWDELRARGGRALAARTRAELAALTADTRPGAGPARPAAPAWAANGTAWPAMARFPPARAGEARAGLRAHKPRRRHVPSRAGRAMGGGGPVPGPA